MNRNGRCWRVARQAFSVIIHNHLTCDKTSQDRIIQDNTKQDRTGQDNTVLFVYSSWIKLWYFSLDRKQQINHKWLIISKLMKFKNLVIFIIQRFDLTLKKVISDVDNACTLSSNMKCICTSFSEPLCFCFMLSIMIIYFSFTKKYFNRYVKEWLGSMSAAKFVAITTDD